MLCAWLLLAAPRLVADPFQSENLNRAILKEIKTQCDVSGFEVVTGSLIIRYPATGSGEIPATETHFHIQLVSAKVFTLVAGQMQPHQVNPIYVSSIGLPARKQVLAVGEIPIPGITERARTLSLFAAPSQRIPRMNLLINDEIDRIYRPRVLEQIGAIYPSADTGGSLVIEAHEDYATWKMLLTPPREIVLTRGSVIVPQGARIHVMGSAFRRPPTTPGDTQFGVNLQGTWKLLP